ncbi:O-antigen ligase family protein [Planomicrobium sp. CPCC 101110]|uniref:O-antigen ligase family protein n=1 Tax=Planomicrobium sp. CPCC 101110 TaxID=2599619 RepID=UPI0011B67CDD|nr:O-antigen ligase family protein [Planomicrobium sp. CPCC 101110]TWT27788.1 hypothetical protein FQV30_04565 [Planomicrobium sp. CPCC 101110]
MSIIDSRETAEAKYVKAFSNENIGKKQSGILEDDLLLFYILWPIIITPKEVQFVFLFLVTVLLLKRHKLYFDTLSFFLFSYILLYAFSIFLNLLIRSSEFVRVLAAFNSLGTWVLAVLLYLIYKNLDIDMKRLYKISFINYSILIIVWIITMVIHTITSISELNIMTRRLYYTEYFDQQVVIRFMGLMDYSNLIIMFGIFFYPLYFIYIRNFKHRTIQVVLLIIGIFPLISSYSRSGYIIIGTAIIIGIVYFVHYTMNRNVFFSLFLLISSILIAVFFFTDIYHLMSLQIEKLMAAREGSNKSRGLIVEESMNIAFRESPFIGMGIKEISSNGYPLGSHSTFLGFFYKTGIVGLLLGISLFILINSKILFLKSSFNRKIISIFILLMSVSFIVEDIDGANWLLCLYFIFVALLVNENSWITRKH